MAKAVKKKKPKPKKETPTKLNMSFEDAIQMSFAPKIKSKK
jgi:hypothetical protein